VLVGGSDLLDVDKLRIPGAEIAHPGGVVFRHLALGEGNGAAPVRRPGAVIVTKDGSGLAVAKRDSINGQAAPPAKVAGSPRSDDDKAGTPLAGLSCSCLVLHKPLEKSSAELAEEAAELRDEGGFQGLKLRLGRERLAEDIAAIDAVRKAVGSKMSLMVDFNQRLHLGEALERCHAIDDLGLAWIEEPIVYDNLEGCARLTADLKTPVQIGENFYGPRALYTALQMKACDYVMPDFMRIGGVTGWQRAAAIAAAAGIPISTHLYPEVAANVMRVSETAHWLEWQDWANPILQRPYEVKDGKVHIPDVPGLGLEWDEKAVAAHLADSF
jgi:L-alanine-DL-glutamate epimerase-like enolase superfamily enzyme